MTAVLPPGRSLDEFKSCAEATARDAGEGAIIISRTTHDRAAVVATAIELIFATAQVRERRQALEACLREEFADERREAVADRGPVNG
jgi:hypothetical protein